MKKSTFLVAVPLVSALLMASCTSMISGIVSGMRFDSSEIGYALRLAYAGEEVKDYADTAIVLVGGSILLKSYELSDVVINGLPENTPLSGEVVELSPGTHSLGLIYVSGSGKITGNSIVIREFEAGKIYLADSTYSDGSQHIGVKELCPVVFPSTDGSATAVFTRTSPDNILLGAEYSFEVEFRDGRTASYPVMQTTAMDYYPRVSPDKSELILVRNQKENSAIYIDGVETTHSYIVEMGDFVVYSPDLKHTIYMANDNDKTQVYYDGAVECTMTAMRASGDAVFSPDSSRHMYDDRIANKIYLDGETILNDAGVLFGVGEPFSPDSRHYYVCFQDSFDQYYLAIDGVKSTSFMKSISAVTDPWSEDSRFLLTKTQIGNDWALYVNMDQLIKSPDLTTPNDASFSSDGSAITYFVSDGNGGTVQKKIANPLF